MKFAEGCPVRLNSGGATMTVKASQFAVDGNEHAMCRCVWTDQYGVPHEIIISEACLEYFSPATPY